MKFRSILGACVVIAGATMSMPAHAVPVAFGGNFYEFIAAEDTTWFEARDLAAASTHLGQQGYLATITSEAENNFVASLVGTPLTGFRGAWLGGTAGAGFGTGAPGGWLTGPEANMAFTYTNWNPGEPNNAGYIYMGIGDTVPPGSTPGLPGTWFDDSGTQGVPSAADPVVGFFVEYQGVTAVPVPAALPLLAGGLGLLGLMGWRRRRKPAAVAA